MAEKIIQSFDELIDFIYRHIDNNEISVQELEKQASLSHGMISKWKAKVSMPDFRSLMKVFNFLNINLVLKSSENSQGKSMEQEIHYFDELCYFIFLCIDNKGITVGEVEKKSGLSQGILSRWKKSGQTNFRSLMNVFNSLNIQIILRFSKSEEEKADKVNEEILAYINAIISSDMTLSHRKHILKYLKSRYSMLS